MNCIIKRSVVVEYAQANSIYSALVALQLHYGGQCTSVKMHDISKELKAWQSECEKTGTAGEDWHNQVVQTREVLRGGYVDILSIFKKGKTILRGTNNLFFVAFCEKGKGLDCYHKFNSVISHFLEKRIINGRIDCLGENGFKNELCNYPSG